MASRAYPSLSLSLSLVFFIAHSVNIPQQISANSIFLLPPDDTNEAAPVLPACAAASPHFKTKAPLCLSPSCSCCLFMCVFLSSFSYLEMFEMHDRLLLIMSICCVSSPAFLCFRSLFLPSKMSHSGQETAVVCGAVMKSCCH